MLREEQTRRWKFAGAMVVLIATATIVNAQTTAFIYQGRLTDSGNPANGNYDLQFGLFDSLSGGAQIGSTQTLNTVSVGGGVFSVQLNFGVNAFPGANRFLEISVRPSTGGSFATLSPRQQISSTPYAIRTLSATTADGANGPFSFGGIAAPAVAPAGQGRMYFDSSSNKLKVSENGGAFVNLVGSGGVSGSGTTNKLPFWSAGTTLGDSVITQSGGNVGIGTAANPTSKLEVAGQDVSITGFQPFLNLRDTNAGNAIGRIASGNGDISLYPNSFIGGVAALTVKNGSGNFGIGTTAPAQKLHVAGSETRLRLESSLGNGFTVTEYLTNNRQWHTGVGGSAVTNGVADKYYIFDANAGQFRMAIDTSGNVGIGTTDPQARLQIAGTGSNGYTLGVDGHVMQNLDKGGIVKALAFVEANGTIARCYNGTGIINQSGQNCGFTYTNCGLGCYDIDFGFNVQSRFFSVTTQSPGSSGSFTFATIAAVGQNIVEVITAYPRDRTSKCFDSVCYGQITNSAFFIVVY